MCIPCQQGSVSPQQLADRLLNSPHVWMYPHEMAVKLPKPFEIGTAKGTL